MREMTDDEIYDKHVRIRKTKELKYPPNESRCRQGCGHQHDEYRDSKHQIRYKQHQCFLSAGHSEVYCQFSSECGELRIRRVPVEAAFSVNDGAASLNLRLE